MADTPLVCSTCDAPLSPQDFDRGDAITLLRRHYCKKCMTEAVRKSRETIGPSDMFLTPKPHAPGPRPPGPRP